MEEEEGGGGESRRRGRWRRGRGRKRRRRTFTLILEGQYYTDAKTRKSYHKKTTDKLDTDTIRQW